MSLEDSLRQLTTLHNDLTALRSSLPRLLHPLIHCDTYESSAQLVAAFSDVARRAQTSVQRFEKNMEDAKDVIARAEKSRSENPKGIVRFYPPAASAATEQSAVEAPCEEKSAAGSDTPGSWVDELDHEDWHNFAANLQIDKECDDLVIHPHSSPTLTFRIQRQPAPPLIICCGDTKVAHGITRGILSAQQGMSMKNLLGMFASYGDIYSRRCCQCKDILSPGLDFPYLRRKVDGKWQAFHESCV